MHFAHLSKGQGFKFQKTRYTKDCILELIFDLKSEKEYWGTDYQVMPFQNIYKKGQPTDQVDSGIQKYYIYGSYDIGNTLS